MLTVAFGETTMNRTQVRLWYNRFKEGQESPEHVNNRKQPKTLKSSEENDFE